MSKSTQEQTAIWTQYKNGVDYQSQAGFSTKWPEYERFYALDQWPAATEKTKKLPRPVIDVTNFIVSNKVSNVMSSALKMAFTPNDMPDGQEQFVQEAADLFTAHAADTWYDLDQDNLNARGLLDSAILGPCHWHYYWDSSKTGGFGTKYIGALNGGLVDSSCVFFGDPQNVDVQTQPYILIASREDTDLVKEKLSQFPNADKAAINEIVGDSEDEDIEIYDRNKERLLDTKKTTYITRYTRKNGLVQMEISTKNAVVVPSTRLNGNRLYPVETFVWDYVKRSIYGKSELEGLIPIQKSINLLYALMILACQDMGFPKVMVYKGALKNQKITGEIGQIVTNYLNDPNAIQYLQGGQFSNSVFSVVDNLVGYAKTMHGVSEGLTGERIVSDMAAGAIMAIQSQAKQPLKPKERAFYRSMRNIGRIWEEFDKNYLTLPRAMVVKNGFGEAENKVFTGSDYKDVTLNLKVEIGPASEFNEALTQSYNDKMYMNKDISADMYIELAPDTAYPNKSLYKQLRAAESGQASIITDMVRRGLIAPQGIELLAAGKVIQPQVAQQVLAAIPPEVMNPPEQEE